MLSRIARELKNKVADCVRNIKFLLNVQEVLSYQTFSIYIPANHLLPTYQKLHRKYDKFLPHLVKQLDSSDTVIDVGANVGDTLAGMVEQNEKLDYICIEADDFFFENLIRNIAIIRQSKSDLKVRAVKALVGNDLSGVSLNGSGGTKRAVMNPEGRLKSRSLDELVSDASIAKVRLVKSDVDGYDYDVLDSSENFIREHKPIIFFECHCEFEYQKIGYERSLKSLENMGYCDWTVFDNFGEIIVRTRSLDTVIQLLQYVWNQNTGNATRTIYYYDVLVIQDSDAELIDRVLSNY
jgi:FkbM family methyltransferase